MELSIKWLKADRDASHVNREEPGKTFSWIDDIEVGENEPLRGTLRTDAFTMLMHKDEEAARVIAQRYANTKFGQETQHWLIALGRLK